MGRSGPRSRRREAEPGTGGGSRADWRDSERVENATSGHETGIEADQTPVRAARLPRAGHVGGGALCMAGAASLSENGSRPYRAEPSRATDAARSPTGGRLTHGRRRPTPPATVAGLRAGSS